MIATTANLIAITTMLPLPPYPITTRLSFPTTTPLCRLASWGPHSAIKILEKIAQTANIAHASMVAYSAHCSWFKRKPSLDCKGYTFEDFAPCTWSCRLQNPLHNHAKGHHVTAHNCHSCTSPRILKGTRPKRWTTIQPTRMLLWKGSPPMERLKKITWGCILMGYSGCIHWEWQPDIRGGDEFILERKVAM